MAEEFKQQYDGTDTAGMSSDNRTLALIEAERLPREDKKIQRLLKSKELRYPRAVIDLETCQKQGTQPDLLSNLAECGCIEKHMNLLITGKAGTGKSYCACALAGAVLSRFMTAKYVKANQLL